MMGFVTPFSPLNPKKRGFPGDMEAGVVQMETPPPVNSRVKPKLVHEPKEGLTNIRDGTKEGILTDSQPKIDSKEFDDFGSGFFHGDDKNYEDIAYDNNAIMQSHYDNLNIPTGVEAPIPWLTSTNSNEVPVSGSSPLKIPSSHNMLHAGGFPAGYYSSPSPWLPNVNKEYISASNVSSGSFSSTLGQTFPKWSPSEPQEMKTTVTTQGFAHADPGNSLSWQTPPKPFHSQTSSNPLAILHNLYNVKPSYHYGYPVTYGYFPNYLASGPTVIKQQIPNYDLWTGVSPFTYGYQTVGTAAGSTAGATSDPSVSYGPSGIANSPANNASFNPWFSEALVETDEVTSTSANEVVYGDPDEIMRKFQLFKKFDTVEDFRDHHYYKMGPSTGQPSREWTKKIQDEWRILDKNLPDSIYVRVCESRMDLLRAVIVGAEGTPYHDGLYFFDIFFPNSYPNSPPEVYYRSGGLRINPNLYNDGTVCLSLLGTWDGSHRENWIPGLSTMLQVLVSIQGLILNANPYFNEPGFESTSDSVGGEQGSLQYNERTFILSMKTMVYIMKSPPKHFEDFVGGHFYSRARDVLLACQSYIEGAQVGCIVKGGAKVVEEGGKICSQEFRHELAKFIKRLVDAFKLVGANDLDNFLSLANKVESLATTPAPVPAPVPVPAPAPAPPPPPPPHAPSPLHGSSSSTPYYDPYHPYYYPYHPYFLPNPHPYPYPYPYPNLNPNPS